MMHILLICMWTGALSGWFLAAYFYHTANNNTKPDTGIIMKFLVVSAMSLCVGCVIYSFIQSALNARLGM